MRPAISAALARASDPIGALGRSLLAWWDAEHVALIARSGSDVDSITDAVGGRALSGTTTQRPTWSATSFGGRPGLTFDGSNDRVSMASQPYPRFACEMWLLADQAALAADTGTRVGFCKGTTSATQQNSVARVVSSGVNRARGGNGGTTRSGTVVDLSGRHVIRVIVQPSKVMLEVDGISEAEASAAAAAGTTGITLGANVQASSFWNGPIAAALITDPLPPDRAAWLTAYLNARR